MCLRPLSLFPFASRGLPFSLGDPLFPPTFYPASASFIDIFGCILRIRLCILPKKHSWHLQKGLGVGEIYICLCNFVHMYVNEYNIKHVYDIHSKCIICYRYGHTILYMHASSHSCALSPGFSYFFTEAIRSRWAEQCSEQLILTSFRSSGARLYIPLLASLTRAQLWLDRISGRNTTHFGFSD